MSVLSRDEAELMAEKITAISDPVRLQIVSLLFKNVEMTIGQLTGLLPLNQSTVSHHMRILREQGFVTCRKDDVYTWYRLDLESLQTVVAIIQGFAPVAPRRR